MGGESNIELGMLNELHLLVLQHEIYGVYELVHDDLMYVVMMVSMLLDMFVNIHEVVQQLNVHEPVIQHELPLLVQLHVEDEPIRYIRNVHEIVVIRRVRIVLGRVIHRIVLQIQVRVLDHPLVLRVMNVRCDCVLDRF